MELTPQKHMWLKQTQPIYIFKIHFHCQPFLEHLETSHLKHPFQYRKQGCLQISLKT